MKRNRLFSVLALASALAAGCSSATLDSEADARPASDAALPDGASPVDAGADAAPMDDGADAGTPHDGAVADAEVSDMAAPDAVVAEDMGPVGDAGIDDPWDGQGPFPGACRLDITGGTADRRLRWVYDGLDIVLERVDEGLDGTFEREFAFTWADGPARVPCVESGPTPMRTPAADLHAAEPVPSEGGALRGDCGPDGWRELSAERRLVEEQTRLLGADDVRRITRTYAWDADGRLTGVEQAFDETLAPAFAPGNPHQLFTAEYDAAGRVSRVRYRRTVVSTLDAEDALGFVEIGRTVAGDTVTIRETRDFAAGVQQRRETFADGRLARAEADGVVRTLTRDADSRLLSLEIVREGAPSGFRGVRRTLDGQGRIVEVVWSMGVSADSAMPVRRASLQWHAQGNLSRVVYATRRDGAWVEGETWSYGYGCW